MENKKVSFLFKIIFYILVAICFIFIAACSNSKNSKTNSETIKQEDNFKEFLLKGLESGKKVWQLKGDEAVFSMDNPKDVNIKNPKMFFFDKDDHTRISATVDAEEAFVNTETKDMHAVGKVVMFSEKENATLYSAEVFYRNSDAIFYSDKPVKVERAESITKGIGFDAKSDLSVINIHKDVSISYASTDTVKGENNAK